MGLEDVFAEIVRAEHWSLQDLEEAPTRAAFRRANRIDRVASILRMAQNYYSLYVFLT